MRSLLANTSLFAVCILANILCVYFLRTGTILWSHPQTNTSTIGLDQNLPHVSRVDPMSGIEFSLNLCKYSQVKSAFCLVNYN
ncbi:hypothetical protein EMPS_06792 [Entomortierella parvispora]|uniref:Uncharacterized protein n=1 Tax=Entomortierella parvispora TaxID=205924 RepID=A0A9P3HCZ6_9FUNG|nr:hypothetical protein EMPS_06792 [Entomortierella parvispora]